MIGESQQAADTPGVLKRAAEIAATSVGNLRKIISVALLNREIAIVDVPHGAIGYPCRTVPGAFEAEAPAHAAIVSKIAAPNVSHPNGDQLIFVIVGEVAGSVGEKVAV